MNLRWSFVFTRQRRNGERLVDDLHWRLHGQREINGKSAWLLGEEDGQIFLVSVDEDEIQHHGAINVGGEDERNSPPLTTVSKKFTFRQPQSTPYVMTQGDKSTVGYFVHQMTGYETLSLPAGVFKDCLRTDTYYQREGGMCFTSAIHYAPGVGLVRYSFRQINPETNAVVVVGIKELSAVQR
jgi:hypothetical protein